MNPAQPIVPYAGSDAGKKEQVAVMFNNISARYDFLNRLLSFGIDRWWRKKAVSALRPHRPQTILDIATGTGDLALEACFRLNPEKITGVDISEGMLEKGREKISRKGLTDRIELRSGDSENLQFPDASFDAVMVSFGVRNFENLEKGLGEIFRVLKPGGCLMVLEFSRPRNPLVRAGYQLYNGTLLPLLGRLISRDSSAYRYLPASVAAFPEGDTFVKILTSGGFKEGRALPLTFGIVSVYTGLK